MSDIMEYKCPSCGGAIEFNSQVQKMKCPYCDSEFEMNDVKQFNEEMNGQQEENTNWNSNPGTEWAPGETEGMVVYSCQSCGGEIVADPNLGATKCPYCDNNVVFKGQFSGALKPDYVIPFKLDKAAAIEGLKSHLKGKVLLPKVFKDENHIDEVKGLYVPFWLFGADVEGVVNYNGTKVRRWRSGDYDYTETSHFLITREGSIAFDRIPVDGSTAMPDDLMESVEPFDFNGAVKFESAYLAGFLADKYDVDDKVSVVRANKRIKDSTEDEFKKTVVGYSGVTTKSSKLRYLDSQANYAMYPVWILNTTWKDKKYLFAMNGQTGKFVGNLPTDWGKFWKLFSLITILGTAVATLVQWLFM